MIDYPVPFINLEFFFYQVYRLITGDLFLVDFYRYIVDMSSAILPYSTVICLVLLSGIIYCEMRTKEIEHKMITDHESPLPSKAVDGTNRRWSRIVDHLNSENESDWRLAVLEADLILEDMLEKIGYPGATIGDKLKGIERSDFNTIDQAWEAHRTRNLIAHEGGDFRITNREARRVVGLYEQVFKEFHFI